MTLWPKCNCAPCVEYRIRELENKLGFIHDRLLVAANWNQGWDELKDLLTECANEAKIDSTVPPVRINTQEA